tara:strand:- start:893 stop:1114 length:222 start_codon:yes stop_codon:yes gene_type:complete
VSIENDVSFSINLLEKTFSDFKKDETINNLEMSLDYLCKAVGRDIFIIPPKGKKQHILYLKKEIGKTLKLLKG